MANNKKLIKAITGTKDVLPDEIFKWNWLETNVRNVMSNFNYGEIRTPMFEETRLFSRGIGESSDIVSKEMYTFGDGDESVTLKPEMTASVVRAFNEHSLGKKFNLNKLFYISPMFRRERPQKGRYRQFHQFGVEALGCNSPKLDAEMMIIALTIFKELGLKDITLKINSLGITEERENYKKLLKEYLSDRRSELSEESKNRFETNVLRIFDSKNENDQKIIADAPLLIDHLGEESLAHFEEVKKILENTNIHYEIDPKLVRGLDYYTHTTFEVQSNSVGSQSALCGGGRYNKLVEELGGSETSGVGFAAGIERILIACESEGILPQIESTLDVYAVRINKELDIEAYDICTFFRSKGLKAEFDYLNRSIKAQMREANRLGANFVLMIGGDEFDRGNLVLKNMSDGSQQELSINDLDTIYKLIAK